jgi:polar amino acid transport system substrate-binding protein
MKLLCAAVLLLASGAAFAQPSQRGPMSPVPADVVRDLAPTGKLRAAINYGNTVLVQRSAAGELSGITIDLARELGKRLAVPVELVPFDTAGKVFDAIKAGTWDVAFLAIEPVRAAEIAFTAPYVIIEGTYMVAQGSPLKTVGDVDHGGVRVAVGKGSAYDLFLTRTVKHVQLVRFPTSQDAIEEFVKQKLDAAAGVKQPLVEYAKAHPGYRVMEGRFMAIEQAMGTHKQREAGARYLRDFIEEMKASGFVADALKRHNQPDAQVAPAG